MLTSEVFLAIIDLATSGQWFIVGLALLYERVYNVTVRGCVVNAVSIHARLSFPFLYISRLAVLSIIPTLR
jgi:hypothetical protein